MSFNQLKCQNSGQDRWFNGQEHWLLLRGSQNPHEGSQFSVTPVTGDPTPSSGLRGHQAQSDTDMHTSKTLPITKEINNLNFKLKNTKKNLSVQ